MAEIVVDREQHFSALQSIIKGLEEGEDHSLLKLLQKAELIIDRIDEVRIDFFHEYKLPDDVPGLLAKGDLIQLIYSRPKSPKSQESRIMISATNRNEPNKRIAFSWWGFDRSGHTVDTTVSFDDSGNNSNEKVSVEINNHTGKITFGPYGVGSKTNLKRGLSQVNLVMKKNNDFLATGFEATDNQLAFKYKGFSKTADVLREVHLPKRIRIAPLQK